MWALLVRAALTGIFGSAFGKWFLSTRLGRCFQVKLDNCMEYLANKYDLHLAKKEAEWRTQYPHLADKIDNLESKADSVTEQLDKFRNEVKLTREQTNAIRDLAMDIVKVNSQK